MTKPRERFYGMLGVIIVPRNTVVGQKGEKSLPIILEPHLPFISDIGMETTFRHPSIESINASDVFAKKPSLQAPAFDSLYNVFQ